MVGVEEGEFDEVREEKAASIFDANEVVEAAAEASVGGGGLGFVAYCTIHRETSALS